MSDSKDTVRAAGLLEEIIRNADPTHMLRKQIVTGEISEVLHTMLVTSDRLEVTYFIPESVVMKGATGTAEEVIEWPKTGLQEGQHVELVEQNGERQFALKQTYSDPDTAAYARELSVKLWNKIARTRTISGWTAKTGNFVAGPGEIEFE